MSDYETEWGPVMTEPTPTPTTPTPPPPALVDVFGTPTSPADIAATYLADADCWADMPEARPRARCRLKPGGQNRNGQVFVMVDGQLRYDTADVLIDEYAGAKYAEVRAEGARRWEQIDKAKGARR